MFMADIYYHIKFDVEFRNFHQEIGIFLGQIDARGRSLFFVTLYISIKASP